MKKSWVQWALLPAAAAVLVACGGGGGGGASAPGLMISGTAATGAPIANAKIYIVDSQGRTPAGQNESTGTALVTTDANGAYTIPSSALAGLTGPFMLRVVGQMLTDTGDMGPAVFHAVTTGGSSAIANITPLTEAHAALALGAQPSLAYGTSSALQNVTPAVLSSANAQLANALSAVADFSVNPNFVSDPLDATPGVAGDTAARKHDATLDQLAVSVSNGRIVLIDRNQDESNYATGPRVEVVASTKDVLTPAGAVTAKPRPISLERAKQFAARFSEKLGERCDVETEPASPNVGPCDGVTNPSSNIFHTQFKDKGMSAWRWVRGWLSDAFETTDLTGTQVSLVSSTLGSFLADDGTRVYRILLKFTKGSDVVMRQMLVTDDGTYVRAYGNQKNFFFYMAARFNYKADASGQYPYYPKYEQGIAVIMKPWFGTQNDVVFGAHITGAGFPAARLNTNRNRVDQGIELFDRRSFGCSAYAIDPAVYIERNTVPWNGTPDANGGHRWRPDSTTCNPLYDFLRYDVQREARYVLPKKGDVYQVTLYLDASKFAPNTSVQAPAGAGDALDITNSDGVTRSVRPYTFSYTLPGDAFALPDANFDPRTFGFPGVTDATRQNLARLRTGDDLAVTWLRNKTVLSDGAVFGSFYVGRYMSSFDQWRTFEGTATPAFEYDNGSRSENYADLITYNHGTGTSIANVYNDANCGKATINKYRNGSIYTVPLIRASINGVDVYTSTTCAKRASDLQAARQNDPNAIVVYDNNRARKQYVSDRGRLVATSDIAQTLKFNDLISREREGTLNFCSAYKGFVQSRQVYVQLSDINGRQLMEMREVWWDYPNMNAYPSAPTPDRPNRSTDLLYLANTSDGKLAYNGERGFVHPVQMKQGSACVSKVW